MIALGPVELAVAALLILTAAGMSLALAMGLQRQILWAGVRMTIQLLLVGYLLQFIVHHGIPALTLLLMGVMVLAAAHEVVARQGRARGATLYISNLVVLALPCVTTTVVALAAINSGGNALNPQHVIPIFGIILGSAMNSAALTLHSLSTRIASARREIEARLALGEDMREATHDIARSAMVSGTIPIINQMAGAGLITLPGIMSGQILAGQDPSQAAVYQIFLMAILTFTSIAAAGLANRFFLHRISDDRDRLRLDRLNIADKPAGSDRNGRRSVG